MGEHKHSACRMFTHKGALWVHASSSETLSAFLLTGLCLALGEAAVNEVWPWGFESSKSSGGDGGQHCLVASKSSMESFQGGTLPHLEWYRAMCFPPVRAQDSAFPWRAGGGCSHLRCRFRGRLPAVTAEGNAVGGRDSALTDFLFVSSHVCCRSDWMR